MEHELENILFAETLENISVGEVFSLLCEWGFPLEITQRFLDLEIDENVLKYMTESDIKDIFQDDLKNKLKFQAKLGEWRKQLQESEKSNSEVNVQASSSKKLKKDEIFTEVGNLYRNRNYKLYTNFFF
uniref:Uncharacterized protein n=1 Tax=Phlebotomus papatasi TaxID=29031 RepID=A0A1B0DIS3_PHLPP